MKATWGGSGGAGEKWSVEEVTVNDNNKVWLIMTQGAKGIYLIPVVRTSGWCGWVGAEEREKEVEKAKKKVESEGVASIDGWTSEFDKREEWLERENEKLKERMNKGFSITRTSEVAKLKGGKGRGFTWGGEDIVANYVKRLNLRGNFSNVADRGVRFLYKNAGNMEFKNEWREGDLDCHKKEGYFPLDLVILNKSEESTEPSIQKQTKGKQ